MACVQRAEPVEAVGVHSHEKMPPIINMTIGGRWLQRDFEPCLSELPAGILPLPEAVPDFWLVSFDPLADFLLSFSFDRD